MKANPLTSLLINVQVSQNVKTHFTQRYLGILVYQSFSLTSLNNFFKKGNTFIFRESHVVAAILGC